MKKIDKIGGIILRGRKLLVVKKRTKDNREEYIIPGGKREENETDFETLKRELQEEIQVELLSAEHFGGFDDIAIFESIPIHIEVYFANIAGEPNCDSEIKELVWIDRNYTANGIKLGSVLAKFVIPKLVEMEMM
jgi:8-oxo-dGTP pyrophosphatase MutT (NUDIX family)